MSTNHGPFFHIAARVFDIAVFLHWYFADDTGGISLLHRIEAETDPIKLISLENGDVLGIECARSSARIYFDLDPGYFEFGQGQPLSPTHRQRATQETLCTDSPRPIP